jgi:probable rRNA maturation factor
MNETPEYIEHSLEFENCNIFFSNEYSQDLDFDYLNITKKTVKELLNTLKCPKAEKFEFSMKLADNDMVHQLNKQYRNKDYPTNVLSFEEDLDDDFVEFADENDYTYIGDIIFAVPVVIQQAKEQNKTVAEHFAHLVAHSILHIFGFDHIDEKEAEIMEDLEIKILHRLEIKNPYIERLV